MKKYKLICTFSHFGNKSSVYDRFKGKLKKKLFCKPGQKAKGNRCVTMKSTEKTKRKLKAKKGAIKRKTKGKNQKPKRKVRKKRVRLGDSDSTTTPNIDVQSKIAAPKRFASKIQWKENNKYYQFNFNNKKITRTDKPIGSGVKKGNTPGETVKIIETQMRKPRYQKAVLGRIEIRLQSPNTVALKNLPNYKTITKVSNFRR